MKGLSLIALMLGAASLAGATTVYSNCTSNTADVQPPNSGTITPNSLCGGWQTGINSTTAAAAPIGTITTITLGSRYSIALELGSDSGSAYFTHAVQTGSALWDNPNPTLTNSPLLDTTWGPVNCAANAAACAAVISALNAGTLQIRTDFAAVGGSSSDVSSDFVWQVDYTSPVPEPVTQGVMGLGLVAIGLIHRRVRRS